MSSLLAHFLPNNSLFQDIIRPDLLTWLHTNPPNLPLDTTSLLKRSLHTFDCSSAP
eukprot:jgi/Psemu1/59789/gm1.59789_g